MSEPTARPGGEQRGERRDGTPERLRLADVVDRTPVRIALLCFALGATLLFAPWALFGTIVGFDALVGKAAPNAVGPPWLFWAGLGGMLGLAGAWIRLFYRSDQLAAAPVLRYFAAGALGCGAVTATLLLVAAAAEPANPRAWALAGSALLAAALCASTLQRAAHAP